MLSTSIKLQAMLLDETQPFIGHTFTGDTVTEQTLVCLSSTPSGEPQSQAPAVPVCAGKLRDGSRVIGSRREQLQQQWEHWARPCCCSPWFQVHGGCCAAFPGSWAGG